MSLCNFCQARVVEGMLFCEECGTPLLPHLPGSPRPATARLLILPHQRPLELRGPGTWILGRKRGTDSDAVYLDLSPFGAYEQGVSRKHARLEITPQGRAYLTDLGSRNGTWIDDRRLIPHRPYPLPQKAILRLGRLEIEWYHPPS